MRGAWAVAMLGVLGCLAAGCGFSKDRQSAEMVADEYLTAVADQDLDKAMSLCHPRAFDQGITEKEWRKLLAALPKKLGETKRRKVIGWRVDKRRMVGLTGTFWTFTYEVTYAKHRSQEAVTLFRPIRGDHFLVLGHNINCKGLVL
jgi:hypothetical protein